MHITVKNCTFHNNTSDSLFISKKYQGSAGGISIGYNFNVTNANALIPPADTVTNHITDCTFTDNSARLFNGQGGTSDVLTNEIFPGRGGAIIVLVSTDLKLTFNFSDNVVMNNFAEVFAGGVYCLTHESSSQAYTFNNNDFISNTALRAGGLGFFYTKTPTIAIHNIDIYNCTFHNNTVSQKGGAALIYSVYELHANVFVTFKECNFFNNTAMIHGGAVDVVLFSKTQTESLIAFVNWLVKIIIVVMCYYNELCSTFESNVADYGAAMNLYLYGAKFYNVTFKDNRESAVRVSF